MTRTRSMNADEIERILERYGFELISQKAAIASGATLIATFR